MFHSNRALCFISLVCFACNEFLVSKGEKHRATSTILKEIDNDVNIEASESEFTTESPPQPIFTLQNIDPNVECLHEPCVMKCCHQDQMIINASCSPRLKSLQNWSVELYDNKLPDKIVIQVSFPVNPNPNATCVIHDKNEFSLQKDGSLLFLEWHQVLDHRFYCVDTRISENDGLPQEFGALCYEPRQLSDFSKTARRIQVTGHIISCVCLAVILTLHFPISAPRSLQDKSFICLCVSLLLGFAILILNMTPAVVNEISYGWCLFIALSSQYFLLSFYFWLTVRCYDIVRNMWGTVHAIPLSQLNSSRHRFAKFCLVSYGIPFIITASTGVIQHLSDDIVPYEWRPNIGDGRCWIEEKLLALGVYYYGYQILLHILNILFMGFSAYLLFKEGQAFHCCYCKNHPNSKVILNVHNKPNLQMFWQQFYIFMLYVILWAFDSISLISPKNTFWSVFDIVNSLQGLLLLLIVLKYSSKAAFMKTSLRKASLAAMESLLKLKKPIISLSPFNSSSNESCHPTSQTECSA